MSAALGRDRHVRPGRWWQVDEVVVVDDHITGVLSEHQAGNCSARATLASNERPPFDAGPLFPRCRTRGQLGAAPTFPIRSTSSPVSIESGLARVDDVNGLDDGEQHAFYRLDEALKPVEAPLPENLRVSVERIRENCEPALCSVLFMGGAGGSLRAGVTENPVRLTRSVRQALTTVTAGGAPVVVWPGGGITFMVDVMLLPDNAFGYVPTPAIVAPIEFTMRLDDYAALGGHVDHVRPVSDILAQRAKTAAAPVATSVAARSGT